MRKGLRGGDGPHGSGLDSAAMTPSTHGENPPEEILRRSVQHGRVHSAYLLTGSGGEPARVAERFVRALVCREASGDACEDCDACRRSRTDPSAEPIVLDGQGRRGPTHRHVGDHPDLFWIERGRDDTRVTIGQIRELQIALRRGANEGGRRAAVIDEAQWLTPQAQNALLRLLEEPPPETTLVLVASHASAIIPTIRSRSVRIRFPVDAGIALSDGEADAAVAGIVEVLDGLAERSVGQLLDFAERYRGARAVAAEGVTELIDVAAQWLVEDVKAGIRRGERPAARALDAHRSLQQLRRELSQRNANPQMVAERVLLGLRDVVAARARDGVAA